MAQLAADVSATALRWRVDTLPAAQYLKVDDEIVEVLSRRRRDTTIRVRRGIEGTAAASHDSGAELTAPAFGGGGADGVTVDNQSDPPAEVTTLVAPGATISGGTAQLLYVQEADPGAIGANALWVRKIPGGLGFHQLLIRNETNDDWLGLAPVILQAGADATTMLASADNEVNMFLAVAGEESSQIHGNRTTFSGTSGKINNIASASVPSTHAQLAVSTTDPSAGAGQARTLGSLWIRQNGTAGELWVKTGEANTAWTKLTP